MTQLVSFFAAIVMAVSAGRAAIMPVQPPINTEPPAVYDAEPVEVPLPENVSEIVEEPEEPTMIYLGEFKITGYDPHCAHCCGKTDGITASGTVATVGYTCAGGSQFEIGTRLYIDGLGERVVEDRGGFPSTTIDVVCEDHAGCYAITGNYDVYIIEEAAQ